MPDQGSATDEFRALEDDGIETEEDVLFALRGASRFSDVAMLLYELGIPDEDVADATGANPRTVRAWRDSPDPPKVKVQRERLDDLRVVVLHIMEDGTLKTQAIPQWLELRNHRLDFRRPLDAIQAGEWESVIEAAHAAWMAH